jgi:DNA polymerase
VTNLHIDFETRSIVDLKTAGVYVYADHPLTDVTCAAYAFDDGPVQLWRNGDPCPGDIFDHVLDGGIVTAHNAQFERILWGGPLARKHGWPVPELTTWRCTMVRAFSMALPGSLENAAAAVGLSIQKDMAGNRLAIQMSKPRRMEGETPVWWDDADRMGRLEAYCRQDVEVERALDKRLLQLRPAELKAYHLDQQINDRGIPIDKSLCLRAKKIVGQSVAKLDIEINKLTDGEVAATTNVQQLIAWLRSKGIDADSVAKDKIEDMLARELPKDVRRALELRRDGSKTSTAKIDAMLKGLSADNRVRGCFQFHGAAQTGRAAGRRIQPQNLPRGAKGIDPEEAVGLLQKYDLDVLEALYESPTAVVSSCIRAMIAAPKGHRLLARDLSNIEGRMLAWLAGEEWKLEAFRTFDRGQGPDLYRVAAAGIYGIKPAQVDDTGRQIGKVSELALGYGGGPGAYAAMGVGYGLKIADYKAIVFAALHNRFTDAAIEAWGKYGQRMRTGLSEDAWITAEAIKRAWREAHPATVEFWAHLEAAAIGAVEDPGSIHYAGRIAYRVKGSFLLCRLPSGRCIAYAYPRVEEKPTPWGTDKLALVYKGVDTFTRKWCDQQATPGLLAENVTQAASRDVLFEHMETLDARGYPIVLHVHDELVAEMPDGEGSLDEIGDVMQTPPAWALDLPLASKGWEGTRYRKD